MFKYFIYKKIIWYYQRDSFSLSLSLSDFKMNMGNLVKMIDVQLRLCLKNLKAYSI